MRARALTLIRAAAPDVLAAAAVACAVVVVFGKASLTYISPDPLFGLVWGNDLVNGRVPGYAGPFASTPHPLLTAAGAFASLFGGAAPEVMRAIILLALGALVVGDGSSTRGLWGCSPPRSAPPVAR